MVTYREIHDDVRARYDRVVKTCWIAHVKELNGFVARNAPNRRSTNSRVYPCPPDARVWIEDSMRRLGMLS